MAWLIHPDDLARFPLAAQSIDMPKFHPPGAIEVRRNFVVRPGHIVDTDHPEFGAPTFAEFGVLYSKAMDRELAEFRATVKKVQSMMPPLPEGTAELLRRTYRREPTFDLDAPLPICNCQLHTMPGCAVPVSVPGHAVRCIRLRGGSR
jgi:hypothetical protein